MAIALTTMKPAARSDTRSRAAGTSRPSRAAAPSGSLPAAEFKAGCLRLLDDVARHGHSLVVTKRGRPVARVLPMPAPTALFGALAGSVRSSGDIVSPLADVRWDAER